MNLQELIDTVKANIPSSIKNNVIVALGKGLGKLTIALVDVPTARLEGAAKITRAKTDARIEHITAASHAGAELFGSDPDLAERAVNYFGQEIIQGQRNRENVAIKTIQKLNQENFTNETKDTVDEDWLTQFWNLAASKSSDEVQEILAKILAKEVTQPKTISPNTLMLLSVLTSDIGKTLQKVSNLTIDDGELCFIAVPDIEAFVNYPKLQPFGVDTVDLFELEAMRLIRSAQTTQIRFSGENKEYFPIDYAGKKGEMKTFGLTVHMLFFTSSGRELRNLIQLNENEPFTTAMKERYKDAIRIL